MAEEVSIAGLMAEQAARRAGIMVRVQSFLILLLLVCVAEEYNHNQYFQEWATRNLGMFGFLLGGTLAAFYSGILIAVYLNQPLQPETHRKAKKREPVMVSPETQ